MCHPLQAYVRMDTQNNLTLPVTALCIDIDHTDEQTKDIFVRACLLEYVLGAFISISGRGVKLFIRIDIDGVNDYPAIYEATAKLVSTVLGVENDGNARISPIPASDHTTRTHTTTVTQRPSTTFCRTVHSPARHLRSRHFRSPHHLHSHLFLQRTSACDAG